MGKVGILVVFVEVNWVAHRERAWEVSRQAPLANPASENPGRAVDLEVNPDPEVKPHGVEVDLYWKWW